MKKMITCLTVLAMLASAPTTAVFAADTAPVVAAAAEKANEYGYYPITDPIATSISVASIAGTWTDVDSFEKLVITKGADIYNGNFTFTDKNGKTISGYIKFEYSLKPDNTREYWYTFYESNGKLWNAFIAQSSIQLDYISAGQSGDPYFMHYLFGGSVATQIGGLNLRSSATTASAILDTIPQGTQLNIFDSAVEGWYKTKYNGKIGYVSADYIKKIEDYEPKVVSDREKAAIEKINNMNIIIKLTHGSDSKLDEFYKVDHKGLTTIESAKALINDTCTGELRDELLEKCKTSLLEKNGELYIRSAGCSFFTFLTDNGVDIVEPAMDYYAAITKKSDQMNDYGRAVFNNDNGEWKISDYEFGYFTTNKADNDLTSAAKIGIENLGFILSIISEGAEPGAANNIKVNGIEYGKAKNQEITPKIMKEYIERTCTGELKTSLSRRMESHLIEKDGVVYIEVGGKGSPDFNLEKGLKILSSGANKFKVVTVGDSKLSGYGIFDLEAGDGDKWYISGYSLSSYPEERLFGGYVDVNSSTLNLRSQPNTSSTILASIPDRTQLDIYACDTKGWYKTVYNGSFGYVSADYIKKIPDSDVAPVKYGDANCDNGVDLSDVVMIMQALANPDKYGINGTEKSHITAQGIKNADVIGNNGMTTEDAGIIQKYLLGLVPEIPVK